MKTTTRIMLWLIGLSFALPIVALLLFWLIAIIVVG